MKNWSDYAHLEIFKVETKENHTRNHGFDSIKISTLIYQDNINFYGRNHYSDEGFSMQQEKARKVNDCEFRSEPSEASTDQMDYAKGTSDRIEP